MHDVFISYEHNSKTIADNIVAVLESERIRCWYAPRDVSGDYATSIVEAIRSSKVFVLVLNEKASESNHVLNEVEIAYKQIIEGNLTLLPFKLDDADLSMAMEYYIKRLHWIDASSASIERAIEDLLGQIRPILPDLKKEATATGGANAPNSKSDRKRALYYKRSSKAEQRRLAVQQRIFKDFDQPYYDAVVCGRKQAAILDLGSATGDKIVDRLGSRPEVGYILGMDCDGECTARAVETHGSETVDFRQCDLESGGFNGALDSYLEEKGLRGFDVLIVSMLLLHLRNPYKVLRTARRHMNDGGSVLVLDIDDALKIASPDRNGHFARAIAIDAYTDVSGYRESGRQVYSLLKKAGFTDITLEREGLTTIGMSHGQRSALFDACFSYIRENISIQCERYPDDEKCAVDKIWLENTYDDMEDEFQSEDLFFQAPMMLFTAKVDEGEWY